VPSARAYPLGRLMEAVADYQAACGQRVFVEYVLLAGALAFSPHTRCILLGAGRARQRAPCCGLSLLALGTQPPV
jgi:hypothetical protein